MMISALSTDGRLISPFEGDTLASLTIALNQGGLLSAGLLGLSLRA
jgi:hypothetical protein